MKNNEEISVKIFDLEHGLTEYKDIKFIRIISDDYNLLIMKDYMPIMGEIKGSISMTNDELNIDFNKVKAYYMFSDNKFNLMIKEENVGE